MIEDQLTTIARSRWTSSRLSRICVEASTELMVLRKRVVHLEQTYEPEYRMVDDQGRIDPHWEQT